MKKPDEKGVENTAVFETILNTDSNFLDLTIQLEGNNGKSKYKRNSVACISRLIWATMCF